MPRLFRYTLSLFAVLPVCRNIRTTVNREHNHSSPAAQTRLHIPFSECAVPSHTNRLHYESFRVPENACRFHNTVPPSAGQSSDCEGAQAAPSSPAPFYHSSLHRRNMLLFYFQPTLSLKAETLPTRKLPPHTARDSTIPGHNNIAAADLMSFPQQAASGISSNSGPDPRFPLSYDRSQYPSIQSGRLAE